MEPKPGNGPVDSGVRGNRVLYLEPFEQSASRARPAMTEAHRPVAPCVTRFCHEHGCPLSSTGNDQSPWEKEGEPAIFKPSGILYAIRE